MKQLKLTNLGQIKTADIRFGDLTLFIGPQATGKSILLELIKLLLDSGDIVYNIKKNGYDWEGDTNNFIEFYFGDGMRNLWSQDTKINCDEKVIKLDQLLNENSRTKEQLFFMPAQRVLTIENGWPRSFLSFEVGDPYIVRNFSEHLRLMMQQGLGKGSPIFPQKDRLNQELRDALDHSIFHGAQVELNTTGMRKRIQINMNGNPLSFMAWSAGQREFMPLLLGLYWLMPASKTSKKSDIDWVVIEEPEMGLHPQAILSVILMCLELLHRGYRLLISTHSPVLLEAVWAIRLLQKENPSTKYLYQLFDLKPSPNITELFDNILKNKEFLTYYFDQQKDGVSVRDISSLDPFDPDYAIANWGGLTSFSSQASEVVSQAIQEKP